MHALSKYLESWAEPEAKSAYAVTGRYGRCLVVPACREEASLVDGYRRAAATSSGRTLAIVVVNGSEGAPPEHHRENERFLRALLGALESPRALDGAKGMFLGATAGGDLDVLVIDRASEGARLPPKTGVGLARKIGTDVALALHATGRVDSPFVFGTDADATLPEAHFERPELGRAAGGALVFPFWHVAADDEAVTRATALYELSLRYYVAGLSFARSPYAFHTVGSATAVSVEAYAAVRGTPKREAGEDFYLLGKIAKVGPVVRASLPAVELRSRTSDRTPFGTGAGVARTLLDGQRPFYAPACFVALARMLRGLDALAEHSSVIELFRERAGLSPPEWDAASAAMFATGGREALEAGISQAKDRRARWFHVHAWFDAFRTRKFIHALRDRVWPSVPWGAALATAPFTPTMESDGSSELRGERLAFARQEASIPPVLGIRASTPAALRAPSLPPSRPPDSASR